MSEETCQIAFPGPLVYKVLKYFVEKKLMMSHETIISFDMPAECSNANYLSNYHFKELTKYEKYIKYSNDKIVWSEMSFKDPEKLQEQFCTIFYFNDLLWCTRCFVESSMSS